MTAGPATILAFFAALLGTLAWFIGKRLAFPDWLVTFLLVFFTALVILAGPLVHLP